MKLFRPFPALLVAAVLLPACGEPFNAEPEAEISAKCESMPDASDSPMEEMPDDDQGIIQI